MNSIVENLLKEMEKCNFKNNRCDYLLEHSEIDYLLEYIDQLQQEKQKYKEVIDKAKDKLQLLIDIGFDYDGFNQVDSLKTLIDELVGYAVESKNILKEA